MLRPSTGLHRVLFACLVLALVSAPAAFPQATDANLVGTVLDQSGAAITGAEVEATNIATNVKTTTMTNNEGQYRIGNLPVGQYDVKVTKPGFSTSTLRNVRLALNTTATANVNMQVGEVATSIEITDTAPLIDTSTAQIGTTFQAREAIDTPLAGLAKGAYNLSLLSAGVASSGGIGLGEGPSVGGQRPRNNSFNIEGVDNNRKDVTGITVNVPNEATEQFSILLNQYSAEFGNGTGGQFNTVVKGGGNQIHGSLYEYFNNRHLNAMDQNLKRQNFTENPRFDDNRFGGSIGGPILKDKLFYYGLFEYNTRGNQGAAAPLSSPTAAGYAALSSIAGLSRTNLDVLRKYLPPAPTANETLTVNGVSVPVGILPITKPSYTNQRNWVVSGDYNLSSNDRFRVRYVNNDQSGFDESVLPALPAFFDGRNTKSSILNFSEFHSFSPSLVNEFRFGFQRFDDAIPAGSEIFPGLDTFPNIEITELGAQIGPYTSAPQATVIDQMQFVDNATWIAGNHSLKLGVEARQYWSETLFVQRQRGDYNYRSLQSYLRDEFPDGSVLAERTVGQAGYNGDQRNFSAFANDDYRFRPNLTFNLGLRWEYKGVPEGDKDWEQNRLASVPGLIEFRTPKVQKTAFAPRIGVAYSPGASGKTSIRAGFGLAYDKYFDNISTNTRPPQAQSTFNPDPRPNFLATGAIPPNAAGEEACNTTATCRALTSGYLYDQQLPYSIQWNFGVQHAFAEDYTVEIRYLGTRGVHLLTQSRINVRPRTTDTRFLPTFLQAPSTATLASLPFTLGDIQTAIPSRFLPEYANAGFSQNITAFPYRGNSTYHGLATELTRRFARGLLFKVAYTWSHNIDDSTADLFSTVLSPRRPQDFQNMRPERSDSFLDRTHRFTYNWVWDTPWFSNDSNGFLRNILGNYTLSGTYIYESPQYVTAQSNADANLNGDAAGDRTIINPAGAANTGSGVYAVDRTGTRLSGFGSAGTVAYVALNPNAEYIVAQVGAKANGGRQTLPTRPINNWDFQVKKQFVFREQMRLQFAAQFVNLFNHPQYIPGYLNIVQFRSTNDGALFPFVVADQPEFGRPDLVFNSNARSIQMTARFQF
jgi:hypothetical protein